MLIPVSGLTFQPRVVYSNLSSGVRVVFIIFIRLLSRIRGLIPAPEIVPSCDISGFHSLIGAKAVGFAGNYSNVVVEAFDGVLGDVCFCAEAVQG